MLQHDVDVAFFLTFFNVIDLVVLGAAFATVGVTASPVSERATAIARTLNFMSLL